MDESDIPLEEVLQPQIKSFSLRNQPLDISNKTNTATETKVINRLSFSATAVEGTLYTTRKITAPKMAYLRNMLKTSRKFISTIIYYNIFFSSLICFLNKYHLRIAR